jgi:hypothetical protein
MEKVTLHPALLFLNVTVILIGHNAVACVCFRVHPSDPISSFEPAESFSWNLCALHHRRHLTVDARSWVRGVEWPYFEGSRMESSETTCTRKVAQWLWFFLFLPQFSAVLSLRSIHTAVHSHIVTLFSGAVSSYYWTFSNYHWANEWYFICSCILLPRPLLKNSYLDLTWAVPSSRCRNSQFPSAKLHIVSFRNSRTMFLVASRFWLRN